MEHIDIVMATYNGELYVKQQIISIIAQNYPHWTLYIHDDGSSDGTVNVINELVAKDSRIKLIDDGVKFGNPGLNFLHLLKFTTSNKICFCDQDDIWFENKLSELLSNFPENNNEPTVLFSSAYIYQTATNQISGLLDYKIYKLKDLIFINGGIHGCRAMINSQMKNQMLRYDNKLIIHDHILSLIACSFGKIKYINTILFLYRQHNKNVSGQIDSSFICRIKKALKRKKNSHIIDQRTYLGVKKFKQIYSSCISSKDLSIINLYLDMPIHSKLKKIRYIIQHRFKRNGSTLKLILLILFFNYSKFI